MITMFLLSGAGLAGVLARARIVRRNDRRLLATVLQVQLDAVPPAGAPDYQVAEFRRRHQRRLMSELVLREQALLAVREEIRTRRKAKRPSLQVVNDENSKRVERKCLKRALHRLGINAMKEDANAQANV